MRYLLIDALLELIPHERAVSRKTFDRDEEFFRDHFPGHPIVPGALLTEAMSQTAGWLIAASLGFAQWPLLSMVHAAKFRRFVAAGEPLRVEAVLESMKPNACQVKAGVTRDDARVAEASLSFQIFPLSMLGDGQPQFADWTRETFARLGGPQLMVSR